MSAIATSTAGSLSRNWRSVRRGGGLNDGQRELRHVAREDRLDRDLAIAKLPRQLPQHVADDVVQRNWTKLQIAGTRKLDQVADHGFELFDVMEDRLDERLVLRAVGGLRQQE